MEEEVTVIRRSYDDTDGYEETKPIGNLSCAIMEESHYCRVYRNDGAIGTIGNKTLALLAQERPDLLQKNYWEHLKSLAAIKRYLNNL